jgi:hypothetical protein
MPPEGQLENLRGGLNEQLLVDLLTRLANPAPRVERVLAASLAQGPRRKPPETPASDRLGNGVVKRAIAKVLAAADEPMRLGDIHQAVGRMLGKPVSYASVEWCMRTDVKRQAPQFERVQPGSYRLAP